MGRKTLKLYSAQCKTKIDYGCQMYNTASTGRLKKLDSIHRESVRIYTGVFRNPPEESIHTSILPGTKMERIGTKIPVYTKKQLLIHRDIKYTRRQ